MDEAAHAPGTAWLLVAAVALTVAVSIAAVAATRCPRRRACPVDTAKLSLTGVEFGQAVVAILAVLAISGEYSTGMIRTTLTAMPRRLGVLAAKAVVAHRPGAGRRDRRRARRACWPGG